MHFLELLHVTPGGRAPDFRGGGRPLDIRGPALAGDTPGRLVGGGRRMFGGPGGRAGLAAAGAPGVTGAGLDPGGVPNIGFPG